MKSAFNRSILALAAILVVAGASQASAQDKALKKYESGTKDFWTHRRTTGSSAMRPRHKKAWHRRQVRRPALPKLNSPR